MLLRRTPIVFVFLVACAASFAQVTIVPSQVTVSGGAPFTFAIFNGNGEPVQVTAWRIDPEGKVINGDPPRVPSDAMMPDDQVVPSVRDNRFYATAAGVYRITAETPFGNAEAVVTVDPPKVKNHPLVHFVLTPTLDSGRFLGSVRGITQEPDEPDFFVAEEGEFSSGLHAARIWAFHDDGTPVWHVDLQSEAGIVADRLVGMEGGKVLILEKNKEHNSILLAGDGKEIWRYETRSKVKSVAVAPDGTIFFLDLDDARRPVLATLNSENGQLTRTTLLLQNGVRCVTDNEKRSVDCPAFVSVRFDLQPEIAQEPWISSDGTGYSIASYNEVVVALRDGCASSQSTDCGPLAFEARSTVYLKNLWQNGPSFNLKVKTATVRGITASTPVRIGALRATELYPDSLGGLLVMWEQIARPNVKSFFLSRVSTERERVTKHYVIALGEAPASAKADIVTAPNTNAFVGFNHRVMAIAMENGAILWSRSGRILYSTDDEGVVITNASNPAAPTTIFGVDRNGKVTTDPIRFESEPQLSRGTELHVFGADGSFKVVSVED